MPAIARMARSYRCFGDQPVSRAPPSRTSSSPISPAWSSATPGLERRDDRPGQQHAGSKTWNEKNGKPRADWPRRAGSVAGDHHLFDQHGAGVQVAAVFHVVADGDDAMISMRPWPTLLLPCHS